MSIADRLGIEPKTVVQELGWGEDCDEAVRSSVKERTGSGFADKDADSVDVAMVWWRESDGDLTDTLTDAIGPLAGYGPIWVLTPKVGRDGYVEPSEIAEAAVTAGLANTSSTSVGDDWTGTRLVIPKLAHKVRH
ncbi:DUF3052 domain-containing protein [Streptomyces sp. NPDC059564]|uniref:DUF3052 domain-containing protein n=1 Tax=Streptomyces sp. NPDC059564 TaxID=3346865 RepID=UPI0036C067B7